MNQFFMSIAKTLRFRAHRKDMIFYGKMIVITLILILTVILWVVVDMFGLLN